MAVQTHIVMRLLAGAALVLCLLSACEASGDDDAATTDPTRRPAPVAPSVEPTYVRVPDFPAYVSVERAQRELSRVGLVGVAPDVDYPHYFVGTEPPAGTRVQVGSHIELMIGDG